MHLQVVSGCFNRGADVVAEQIALVGRHWSGEAGSAHRAHSRAGCVFQGAMAAAADHGRPSSSALSNFTCLLSVRMRSRLVPP